MILRIETNCFYLELNSKLRGEYPFYDDLLDERKNVWELNFHFYVRLPVFEPDSQHIRWVKEAWGKKESSTPLVAVDDLDDLIPF